MAWYNIFSAGNTLEKGVDAIISAGDKLVYTDEEKAEMKHKHMNIHIKMLEAYHPFKVTQRILAMWFSFLFGISFLTGLGISITNIYIKFKTPKGEDLILLDMQPLIDIVSSFGLFIIVLTIVGFYFGGGTIESFKNTLRGKK